MNDLERKVLLLAAQICRLHAYVAGNRVCQDWSGQTDVLDSLTPAEREILNWRGEQHNSRGREYEPGYFPYDEMWLSFTIEYAIRDYVESQTHAT